MRITYHAIVTGLYVITDGAASQCKNRFMAVAEVELGQKYKELRFVNHNFPPTATFKGVHDGEGHVDRTLANDMERRETHRFHNTRKLLDALWEQNDQPNPPQDLQKRSTHTLDARVRVLVMDEADNPTEADRLNPLILITHKSEEAYNACDQDGIMDRSQMCAFKDSDGDWKMKVKFQYDSCDHCRGKTTDINRCTYEDQMGPWKTVNCCRIPMPKTSEMDQRLLQYFNFLKLGGPLPTNGSNIVIAYFSGRLNLKIGIVTILPYKLESAKTFVRKIQKIDEHFKTGEFILEIMPLEIKDVNDSQSYVARYGRNCNILIRLNDVVLPDNITESTQTRMNCLGCIVDTEQPARHVYKITNEMQDHLLNVAQKRF